LPLGDDISVRGGVLGKYVDQSLRILMKSEGMAMKAGAFVQLVMNADESQGLVSGEMESSDQDSSTTVRVH
jgi:hypothetical protein